MFYSEYETVSDGSIKWLLMFFMLSLYTVKIASIVSLSDVSIVLFFAYCLFFVRRFYVSAFNVTYFFWFLTAFFLGSFLINKEYFQVDGFLLTSARAFICILVMFLCPCLLLEKRERNACINSIRKILLLHSFIQISFVVLFYMDMAPFLNVVGFGGIGRKMWLNVYDYKQYYRFGGVFEEPSWYSWFIIFCTGIIFTCEKKTKLNIFNRYDLCIIFLGLLFTFSIAGLGSFFVLLFIRYVKGILPKIILFLTLCFSMFFLYSLYENTFFFQRILGIMSGGDGSANVRFFGSLTRAGIVLQNSLFGAGLGNSVEAISYYSNGVFNSSSSLSNQNGFVEPFLSGGLVTGLLFVTPILSLAFHRYGFILFLTISLVLMTMSSIYIPAFFFLLTVSYYTMKFS